MFKPLSVTGLALSLAVSLPLSAFTAAIAPLVAHTHPGSANSAFLVAQRSASGNQNPWSSGRLLHRLNLSQLLYEGSNCPISVRVQALSPDSRTLAISSYSYERSCGEPAGRNSTLTLWDVQTGQRTTTLMQGTALEAFNLTESRAQEPVEGNTSIAGDVAHAVAFTADEQQIIAGLSNGTIKIWNPRSGQLFRTLSGHQYAIHAIALSPNSPYLVSGSSDQTLKVWNLQTGQLLHTLSLRPSNSVIQSLVMNPDGNTVVSVTSSNKVQLWDVRTGRLIRTLYEQTAPSNTFIPVAFSPDGAYVATGDPDHSVKLWSARSGARFLTLRSHQGPVRSLAFHPQLPMLVSSSDDNSVRFWNLRSNQLERLERSLTQVGAVNQHHAFPLNRVAFSPDGRTLVLEALLPPVPNDGMPRLGLRLWDVQQQQFIKEIPDTSLVGGFRFSSDSQLLVAAGAQTQIWSSPSPGAVRQQ